MALRGHGAAEIPETFRLGLQGAERAARGSSPGGSGNSSCRGGRTTGAAALAAWSSLQKNSPWISHQLLSGTAVKQFSPRVASTAVSSESPWSSRLDEESVPRLAQTWKWFSAAL